jgi:hypothetical protein
MTDIPPDSTPMMNIVHDLFGVVKFFLYVHLFTDSSTDLRRDFGLASGGTTIK